MLARRQAGNMSSPGRRAMHLLTSTDPRDGLDLDLLERMVVPLGTLELSHMLSNAVQLGHDNAVEVLCKACHRLPAGSWEMNKLQRETHERVLVDIIATAISRGEVRMLELLLAIPLFATPGGVSNFAGLTMLTAVGADLSVLRVLCELPADVGFEPDVGNNTPLMAAAKMGLLDTVRYLCDLPLSRGVDPSAQLSRAPYLAALEGHWDVVKYLCTLPPSRGLNLGARHQTLLLAVVGLAELDVVEWYCNLPPERGVDLAQDDAAVLAAAVINDRVEAARYLCSLPLERGIRAGACDNKALSLACQFGFCDMVQMLHELPPEHGVSTRPEVRWCAYAAREGHLETLRYLTEWRMEGCCVWPLEHPLTGSPVASAVQRGHARVVRFLVLEMAGGEAFCRQAVRDWRRRRAHGTDNLEDGGKGMDRVIARVKDTHRRNQRWHFARTMLLLRLLCDGHRGAPRMSGSRRWRATAAAQGASSAPSVQ